MIKAIAALAVVAALAEEAIPGDRAGCPGCGWAPPASGETVVVADVAALEHAVARARPGTTILLRDGTYRLRRMLDVAAPDVVLRGASGDLARVVLGGTGMAERQVGVALSVSAPGMVLADLTVGGVGRHGVQVRGESGA